MAIQFLDPEIALVVIDLQRGIAAMPIVHPLAGVVAHSAQLAKAFRQRGLPVVLVNVDALAPGRNDTDQGPFSPPPGFDELLPELDIQPSDHRVTKRQWGAFEGTSLDQFLRRRGVTQIVLTGIATSIGVESTARDAQGKGYNIVLVPDAMTDLHMHSHQHSVDTIFPRLGQVASTGRVLELLAAQAG
jgi:nicotinamidase-related amidase